MIQRDIQPELLACAAEYPVVTVTGPRQAGKTTLVRAVFPEHPYVNFEDPLVREEFETDPRAFLARFPEGAVFDEVQRARDLTSYLQVMVDTDRSPGRFVLTGSQNFGVLRSVSQSLAGRTALLSLLPFSWHEIKRGKIDTDDLDAAMFSGGYPPLHVRKLRPVRWFAGYVATYIERDLRDLAAIRNLSAFQRFMRLCAANIGRLFNRSRIAADCGVDNKTIQHWLTILQACYICTTVPPYHRNFRKRIIKTPKLYFYDTGLACYLLGIHTPQQLNLHPLRGEIFENWVFAEIIKACHSSGFPPAVCFWRTHGGMEADFVVERDGRTFIVEARVGMTVRPRMLTSLRHTLELFAGAAAGNTVGIVVYGGRDSGTLLGFRLVPWHAVDELFSSDRDAG